MSLLNNYNNHQEMRSEVEVKRLMQMNSTAVTRNQIRTATERFPQMLCLNDLDEEPGISLSPLVCNALQMVRKYYDQGITLEEIAERLFVS